MVQGYTWDDLEDTLFDICRDILIDEQLTPEEVRLVADHFGEVYALGLANDVFVKALDLFDSLGGGEMYQALDELLQAWFQYADEATVAEYAIQAYELGLHGAYHYAAPVRYKDLITRVFLRLQSEAHLAKTR